MVFIPFDPYNLHHSHTELLSAIIAPSKLNMTYDRNILCRLHSAPTHKAPMAVTIAHFVLFLGLLGT